MKFLLVAACIAILFVLVSIMLSGATGPQLPNNLGTLPIIPGINEACKVFGC